jgi:peptidoglycan/LPS O-acetylase OafA/YrhL
MRNWLLLGGLFIFAFIFYSKAGFLLASGASMFILFYNKSIPSLLQFPGTISYSIYLIHFPLGIKMINFLKPKVDPAYYSLLFVITLAVVMFSAWIFYKIFEEFSESLSKKVRYAAAAERTEKQAVLPVVR